MSRKSMSFEELRAAVHRRLNTFHISRNQPPKGPHHGTDRRTSPPAHSHPPHGAGGGPRWAQSIPSLTQITRATLPGRAFRPKPPTLPHAGIRAGEIIGFRAWLITLYGVSSLAHPFIWPPGVTVTGDLNKPVYWDIVSATCIWGGVYCFSEETSMNDELDRLSKYIPQVSNLSYNAFHPIGYIFGTVKLWGEVVEHQTGFRGENAKIHSITKVRAAPKRLSAVDQILEPHFKALNVPQIPASPV